MTTRGYRALGLRIHVGPFRLAVRSSQTPEEDRGHSDVVSCRSLEDQEVLVFTREAVSMGAESHVVFTVVSPRTTLFYPA